jgi:hypothetical protein
MDGGADSGPTLARSRSSVVYGFSTVSTTVERRAVGACRQHHPDMMGKKFTMEEIHHHHRMVQRRQQGLDHPIQWDQ